MLGKRAPVEEPPNLIERAFTAGCTRIAVVSLHPGAGARTVVESISREVTRRGIRTGVTRAPRLPLDAEVAADESVQISLPAETLVATTVGLAEGCGRLESVEPIGLQTALGDLGIFRVTEDGPVPVYGPDDPESLSAVLRHLEHACGGLALVDGAWERRGFAAPGVVDGVILVVGAGYSNAPQQSAAAVRYLVEVLSMPRCSELVLRAWSELGDQNGPTVLNEAGEVIEQWPAGVGDPLPDLERLGHHAAAILLPTRLTDEFIGPLVRSKLRPMLIVKDPTRLRVAPVYYRAWLKTGGEIRALQPVRVLAVATNPLNLSGPDVNADRFRDLVNEVVPEVPVHDVVLEAHGRRRSIWKFWS